MNSIRMPGADFTGEKFDKDRTNDTKGLGL